MSRAQYPPAPSGLIQLLLKALRLLRYIYAWSAEHRKVHPAGMQKFHLGLHPPNSTLESGTKGFSAFINTPTVEGIQLS